MSALSDSLSPTRQRGKHFWAFPSLARRAQWTWLLSVALLAALAGHAGAQNQDPDAARRAQEAVKRAEQEALLRRVQLQAAVAGKVGAQQIWPDEQFENWVFSSYGNATGAHQRLESRLTLLVEEIDRACKLTDEQKAKVRLTGQGDIKRFFDGVERAKQKFHSVNNDINRLQEIRPDVVPLQTALQTGLFGDDSLLSKSLHHTLTGEQRERYDAVQQERRLSEHRTNIQRFVAMIEQGAPLRVGERRELIDLLTKETKPARTPSQYDFYLVVFQIGRLPDEKLRPLLDDTQWKAFKQRVDQYRALEPTLRQQGLIPDADGGNAPPGNARPGNAPPVALKVIDW